MKRQLIILTVLGLGFSANAQISNNALGLRVMVMVVSMELRYHTSIDLKPQIDLKWI